MGITKLSHDDYTIAWICALPLEMAAAKAMLEKTHETLPQLQADQNSYSLGEMSDHNIVLVCLPSGVYGTTSAATVLSQMLSTFSSIKVGLMVGIGGGVPSESVDIRLGDVVVSMPSGSSGGVIQYDYGKTLPDGCFQHTGSLNSPPQVLLSAVSQMRSDHMIKGSEIHATIMNILNSDRYMGERFSPPDRDLLFNATYHHPKNGLDCSKCDLSQMVNRMSRKSHEPQIHYGLIASGNQVIKDAKTRDYLAQKLGILCFEMEAAGLMNQLPCLVIRGICDYCDSHKQKHWQGYSALSASAYAKVLLTVVPISSSNDNGSRSRGNTRVQSDRQTKRSEAPSLTFNSYGSGQQFNATGNIQNNNTGHGNQFLGSFAGPVYFGHPPTASKNN